MNRLAASAPFGRRGRAAAIAAAASTSATAVVESTATTPGPVQCNAVLTRDRVRPRQAAGCSRRQGTGCAVGG